MPAAAPSSYYMGVLQLGPTTTPHALTLYLPHCKAVACWYSPRELVSIIGQILQRRGGGDEGYSRDETPLHLCKKLLNLSASALRPPRASPQAGPRVFAHV